jgi:hypothetical protein
VRSFCLTYVLVALLGCVDGFRGSNVQIDLSPRTPVQAATGMAPGMTLPKELPEDYHFTIYAIDEGADLESSFEVQRFEVHKLVNLTSPCFIDVGASARFPGIHVTQFGKKMAEVTGIEDVANPPAGATEEQKIDAATAVQRMANVMALGGDAGLKAVTSASNGSYPATEMSCNGTGLPPPSCIDDASNQRRLELCTQAWRSDPALFEGTDRVLTAPLNGTTFGFVDGINPITPVPVGGASFYAPQDLAGIDEYAIYVQQDGMADPGELLFSGRPSHPTRGVTHVHLDSPRYPTLITAELAIFASLDEDEVHF